MHAEATVPIVASLILVLVGSMKAVASPSVRRGFVVYFGALAVAAGAVSRGVRSARYMPDTLPSELGRYGLEELSRTTERNVLIVDGGSYPARGLDPHLLQVELSRRGYSTSVVLLSMSAGNHFERYEMYRDVLSALNRKRIRNQNWVSLWEVHAGYDVSPFAQLERNQDTARAYHYMTPANAAFGLYALFFGGGKGVKVEHLPWVVLRHALVNAFNVGAATYLVPWDSVSAHSGYISGRRDPAFTFAGIDPAIRACTAPLDEISVPPWMIGIRERRARSLWAPFIQRFVYYGVPSTTDLPILHIRKFCELTHEPCIAPADPALLGKLNRSDMWFNAGHMSSMGATVYSVWLARRLDELGVLTK